MLKLKYEDIIQKIREEKGLDEQDIANRINQKVKQLSNLISKEGAAHIVASDLGIKMYPSLFKKRYKVNELLLGLRSVEIVLKVLQKYEIREFKNEKRSGKLASLFAGDETGTCRLVIWDEKIIDNDFNNAKEGDIIKIANAYVKENNNGYKELHLGGSSSFILNPENETIGEVAVGQKFSYRKKKLDKIEANDFAEITGTIVNVFEPRFYVGCPECYRKLDEKSSCNEHGIVKEKLIPIINMILDDGTDSIRVALFRENVEKLLNINYDKILELRNNNMAFGEICGDILGKQVSVAGKASKNEMFDTIDFNASSVREVTAAELIDEMMPR